MLKIATIDFEATALSSEADVIEVGVAIFNREDLILTWSSLVRPTDNSLWSETSANIHKITQRDLENAPDAQWASSELNRVMNGVPVAYCDGFEYDSRWMESLFRASGSQPVFQIAPIEEMPRMHLRVVRHHMRGYLEQTQVKHRAGEDATRLMQAYTYALGKTTNVMSFTAKCNDGERGRT
jgi:inhibitor of KinA sporulation pathway (predicted exonuclease)